MYRIILILAAALVLTGCYVSPVQRSNKNLKIQMGVIHHYARGDWKMPRDETRDWEKGLPAIETSPYVEALWDTYQWNLDVSSWWLAHWSKREMFYFKWKKALAHWEETKPEWEPLPGRWDHLYE